MIDLCDLYFRQRDTKKIGSEGKCFLEACLKGLPALTFLHEVIQPLSLANPAGVADAVSEMSFFSRKTVPHQSAVQSWSLRSHLASLSTAASRLEAMRMEASQLRDCVARQAKRQADRLKEEAEGLAMIQKEESAIGEADLCLKKADEEIKGYDREIAMVETDIYNLKVQIEKTYDPSRVEEAKKLVAMSQRRLQEVEVEFSTAKKRTEVLEGQVSIKKGLLKSKCNLESTIKKHNDDLEDKICTARKEIEERSASKLAREEAKEQTAAMDGEKEGQVFGEASFNTPVKTKPGMQFGSQLRFAVPGLGSACRTPGRTIGRGQGESPSFSPTYELAEIEHGCNHILTQMLS